ncbi:MAG: hypothetical protein K2M44_02515 [Clostridia bacterium]|nr:hypothetical protein [Clostridia bacterium]
MSACSEEMKRILIATDNFSDCDSLSPCSDAIYFVCNSMDEEGAALLAGHVVALKDLRQRRSDARIAASTPCSHETPKSGKGPITVLRMLTALGVAIVALIVGLCVMYAPDVEYVRAHSALAKVGIVALVIAALFFVIAVLSFVSYCRIRSGKDKKAEIAIETMIAGEADGNAAFDIMLIDMLLKAVTKFYPCSDVSATADEGDASENIGD